MQYIIAYFTFVILGAWLSVADFAFLGRQPTVMSWQKVVFALIPVAFAAVPFRGLATGILYARGMSPSREQMPKVFYFGVGFYLLTCVFIFYVSRYIPNQ